MLSWENEIVGLPHRNTLLQDGIRSFGLGPVYIGTINSAEYGSTHRGFIRRSIGRFRCHLTLAIKRR